MTKSKSVKVGKVAGTVVTYIISIVIAAIFYKRYKNTDSPIYRRIGKER